MVVGALSLRMSTTDTKDRIVRTLRSADDPALSAKKLSDELDVSVRTINNHVDDLVADKRVATTQIGNATAYYVPFEDLPNHKKPDHICARCGREVNERHDFLKVDMDTYFVRGNFEEESSDFFIFCRFCHADFISWVMDPAAIGEYPFVHSWDIPTDQLREVRDDPDIETTPSGREHLDEEPLMLLEFIEKQWKSGEYDRGVPKHEVVDYAESQGLHSVKIRQAIKRLRNGGYLFEPTYQFFQPAK